MTGSYDPKEEEKYLHMVFKGFRFLTFYTSFYKVIFYFFLVVLGKKYIIIKDAIKGECWLPI